MKIRRLDTDSARLRTQLLPTDRYVASRPINIDGKEYKVDEIIDHSSLSSYQICQFLSRRYIVCIEPEEVVEKAPEPPPVKPASRKSSSAKVEE